MTALHAVIAEKLTCIRAGRIVFRDVGFELKAGSVLALEGANGSGKTSLLRMIAGFLAPAAGAIRLTSDGAEISDNEERGNFIGWLGHHDAAKPQLTPRENLRFFCELYGVTSDLDTTLDFVGLGRARDLPCQYLSAGQKKRLALARLKTSNRPLWLLDEPLAALDTDGKSLAANLIQSHCASGGIAIVATHESLGIDCARLVLT